MRFTIALTMIATTTSRHHVIPTIKPTTRGWLNMVTGELGILEAVATVETQVTITPKQRLIG